MSAPKTVLVTGGSRGIGAAVVKRFALEDWRVIFTYVANDAAAAKVADESGARAIKGDVGSEADILALFRTLDDEHIYVDAVVNNAGITGPKRRMDEATWDTVMDVLRVNVAGSVAMCREAVKRMSTAHGGRGGAIVNISSTATLQGSPNQWVDYAGSKGAIDIITKGLAREVGEEGIRVNAVAPGYTMTDMSREGDIAGRFESFRHEVPLGRIGTVEEVAAGIYWLCSDEASYITGCVLPVAGGRV
ncbi:MAG: SDR family oxidoreductase [Rhodospirillales bacterium]|nr:SDR family oxidoreductase [Rhodospirillales bacterium]MBO6788240.1 SDR family oxidoreductase [Rhodospirillales bacterium]